MKKQRESKKSQEDQPEESDWEIDKDFYMSIWMSREHKCYETGVHLGSEPLSTYFHHVLPKEKYPQYRHDRWNIVLVSLETHDQAHIDIEKTPKIYKKYLELLEKHNFTQSI